MELQNRYSGNMFFLDLINIDLYPVFVRRISRSGKTVELDDGSIVRTNSGKHKIFHYPDIAEREFEDVKLQKLIERI